MFQVARDKSRPFQNSEHTGDSLDGNYIPDVRYLFHSLLYTHIVSRMAMSLHLQKHDSSPLTQK